MKILTPGQRTDWMNAITDFANSTGWMLDKFGGYCDNPYHLQRRHIFGKEAKRKINYETTNVGHCAILPIPFELHDVSSNNKLNVTHNKKAFESVFGTQKELLADMAEQMRELGYHVPFDDELIEAL